MKRALLLCLTLLIFTAQALAQQKELTPGDLAATYFTGHNFGGSSLTLETDGSYSIESHDCTTRYFMSGTYLFSDGVLRFTILKQTAKGNSDEREIDLLDPNGRNDVFGNAGSAVIETEFKLLPIRWADRMYLIYEENVKSFANAINLGLEPRSELTSEPYYGSSYIREGDEQKKVDGPPSLPENWRSFLLRKPVTSLIVSLEGTGQKTTARIDKGSKHGLKVGMRLLFNDEEPVLWWGAEVISTSPDAAMVSVGPDAKVGDKLSTMYKRRDIRR